ncbi:hypothetical protein JTB14_036982 [Gonioctena quinquepunctata]|nr:hypothetical protein JTB14_036982 [Gonioctena quinquepunctata]
MEFGYADGGNSQISFFPHLPNDMKEFVATDISERMVEYAKINSSHPLMKFVQMDIATKQVPSEYLGRFDHIFGFFVMHHVQDTRQALENMKNMLKEGGSIFLTYFEHTPIDHALALLAKHPEWKYYGHGDEISPYFFSPNPRRECERNLSDAGFKNYEVFQENESQEFFDEAEYDGLFMAVNTVLPEIPKEKIEEYKKMYLTLLKKGTNVIIRYKNGMPIIDLKYKMFITIAWKT